MDVPVPVPGPVPGPVPRSGSPAEPKIGEALAARLKEPDGPQVVLISTEHSPSYFDQLTMDRTRAALLRRLQAADDHRRLRAYFPRTSAGRAITLLRRDSS